jgi:hypothetical protein
VRRFPRRRLIDPPFTAGIENLVVVGIPTGDFFDEKGELRSADGRVVPGVCYDHDTGKLDVEDGAPLSEVAPFAASPAADEKPAGGRADLPSRVGAQSRRSAAVAGRAEGRRASRTTDGPPPWPG